MPKTSSHRKLSFSRRVVNEGASKSCKVIIIPIRNFVKSRLRRKPSLIVRPAVRNRDQKQGIGKRLEFLRYHLHSACKNSTRIHRSSDTSENVDLSLPPTAAAGNIPLPISAPLITHYSHSRPNAKQVALHTVDLAFGPDTVIITALDYIPFCCHQSLADMTREELVQVAHFLNVKLPAALSIIIDEQRPADLIRSEIEVLVGMRLEELPSSIHNNNRMMQGGSKPSLFKAITSEEQIDPQKAGAPRLVAHLDPDPRSFDPHNASPRMLELLNEETEGEGQEGKVRVQMSDGLLSAEGGEDKESREPSIAAPDPAVDMQSNFRKLQKPSSGPDVQSDWNIPTTCLQANADNNDLCQCSTCVLDSNGGQVISAGVGDKAAVVVIKPDHLSPSTTRSKYRKRGVKSRGTRDKRYGYAYHSAGLVDERNTVVFPTIIPCAMEQSSPIAVCFGSGIPVAADSVRTETYCDNPKWDIPSAVSETATGENHPTGKSGGKTHIVNVKSNLVPASLTRAKSEPHKDVSPMLQPSGVVCASNMKSRDGRVLEKSGRLVGVNISM